MGMGSGRPSGYFAVPQYGGGMGGGTYAAGQGPPGDNTDYRPVGAGTYDPMLGFGQASGMGTTYNYPTRYSADYTRYAQSGQPFNQPVMGYNTYGQIFAQPRRQPPPTMGKGGGGFRPPRPPPSFGKGGGGYDPNRRVVAYQPPAYPGGTRPGSFFDQVSRGQRPGNTFTGGFGNSERSPPFGGFGNNVPEPTNNAIYQFNSGPSPMPEYRDQEKIFPQVKNPFDNNVPEPMFDRNKEFRSYPGGSTPTGGVKQSLPPDISGSPFGQLIGKSVTPDFTPDYSGLFGPNFGAMQFQEGGQVPPDANMEMMLSEAGPANPQSEMASEYDRLIQMTMQAILGQVENPDEVIQMFIDEFGTDAFRQLRDAVLKQQVPNAQTEGMVDGNGGGMDDQVMGMIGNQRPVAVSPGEYIIPADVVSGLGDGSSKSGADILDELNQAVRMARTGTTEQPRPLMETLQ